MGKKVVGCEEWKMTEVSTEDRNWRMKELVSVDLNIRIVGVMEKPLDIREKFAAFVNFRM
jgi:hypothetical protein